MIAAGLGWELDDITETIEPIVAEGEVSSNFIAVKPGQAAGVKQVGRGLKEGKKLITLDFQVTILATPNLMMLYKSPEHQIWRWL